MVLVDKGAKVWKLWVTVVMVRKRATISKRWLGSLKLANSIRELKEENEDSLWF